jgi:hypothetical protein
VIEEASGRLCFVIQAHSPARQQTTPRTLGHRILAVDPATHDLSQSSDFPGTASAWDYSTSRQIVYLLVTRDDTAWLVMRRLDGSLVREMPLGEHVRVAGASRCRPTSRRCSSSARLLPSMRASSSSTPRPSTFATVPHAAS